MADYKLSKEDKQYNNLESLMKDFRDNRDDWRQAAIESYKFRSGHQWKQEDRQKLEQEGRPVLTFNQVHKVISAISGAEISNRYSPRAKPVGMEDAGLANMVDKLMRNMRERCHAAQEESEAFRDAATCGLGVTETYMSYDEDPSGVVCTKRIDPLDICFDPFARQMCLEDAIHVARAEWIPVEKFISSYGKETFDEVRQGSSDEASEFFKRGPEEPHDASKAWMYLDNPNTHSYDPVRGRVLVIEYQYKDWDTAYIYNGPSGPDYVFPDELEDGMLEPTQEVEIPRYYRCLYAGPLKLDEGPNPVNCFTYNFLTGFPDHTNEGIGWFGALELMKDPQKWSNRFLSQIIHIIGVNPKGLLLHEAGAFINENEAKRKWAESGGAVQLMAGGLGRIEVVQPPGLPQAAWNMMRFANQQVPAIVGVNESYFSGQAEDLKRTASSAVEQVRSATLSVLSPLFDAFKRYRRNVGNTTVKFIRDYIPEGTMVRIVGEPLAQYVPLSKDALAYKYDIVVDEAPYAATHPEETFKYFIEQGAAMEMVQAGIFPPELLPRLWPNIDQESREIWSQHIEMMKQAMMQGGQQQG